MAPIGGPAVTRVATDGSGVGVDERVAFVDLVLADAELVDLEFEAIVEAGWGGDGARPRPERRGADGRRGPGDVAAPGRSRVADDLVEDRSVRPHERGPP